MDTLGLLEAPKLEGAVAGGGGEHGSAAEQSGMSEFERRNETSALNVIGEYPLTVRPPEEDASTVPLRKASGTGSFEKMSRWKSLF